MRKFSEKALVLQIRHACQIMPGGSLFIGLQRTVKNNTTAGFHLRPDIIIQIWAVTVAILVVTWKQLDLPEPNSGVSSADAY